MENEKPGNKRGFQSKKIYNCDRVLPNAIDLEEVVLGAIMLAYKNEPCLTVNHFCRPEMFYLKEHQLIFKAIQQLYAEGIAVDILTVTDMLRKKGDLKSVGGPYFVAMLTNRVVSEANLVFHFRIIHQKFIQREIIRLSSKAVKDGFEDTTDVFRLLEGLIKDLTGLDPAISERRSASSVQVGDDLEKELTLVESAHGAKGVMPIMIYETGWPRFDERVTLGRDKIILIGGPAKGGKSRLIRAMMWQLLAHFKDISIKWVTLEDTQRDIIWSYVTTHIFITSKLLKYHKYDKRYIPQIRKLIKEFKAFDIEFIEKSVKSDQILSDFTRFCESRKERMNILIVDNLKALDDNDLSRDQNKVDDHIMKNMSKCKQNTKGLIFVLHHFNDSQQDRANLEIGYRPVIKELKGSEGMRRVPNQVLLINSFNIYKDLMAEYIGKEHEILKHMFIIDTAANRDDSIIDELGLIHYFTDMAYDMFYEIPVTEMEENNGQSLLSSDADGSSN
jgi:replicative DNA helicase